jgi:hypothetical protein
MRCSCLLALAEIAGLFIAADPERADIRHVRLPNVTGMIRLRFFPSIERLQSLVHFREVSDAGVGVQSFDPQGIIKHPADEVQDGFSFGAYSGLKCKKSSALDHQSTLHVLMVVPADSIAGEDK